MGAKYRLFGTETSPYSVKVRSYLRYKKIPFDWVIKGYGTDAEFKELARSQALPMLVSPRGAVAHDSSLILAKIEKARNKPGAMPRDPACRALACLLEDYADEWLNKAMYQYRWGTTKSAKVAAARQAEGIFNGFEVENLTDIEKSIAKSMTGRLKLIGSTKKTVPVIEASFARFLALLNAHLEHHLFLFGGHPSIADFAIAGQLSQLAMEDVSGKMIRETAPFVSAWCEFMEDPRPGAPFEDFDAVKDTLLPLIRDEVALTYVMWAETNQQSIDAKRKTVTVEIDEDEYKQSVQTNTASSYAAIKAMFAQTPATPAFAEFIEDAGLGEVLELGAPVAALSNEDTTDEDADDDGENENTSDDADMDSEEDTSETAVIPDAPENSAEAESVPEVAAETVSEPEAETAAEPETETAPEAKTETVSEPEAGPEVAAETVSDPEEATKNV
jgi:glutathione S-transferase